MACCGACFRGGEAYGRPSPGGTLDTMSVTAKLILAPLQSRPGLQMEFMP